MAIFSLPFPPESEQLHSNCPPPDVTSRKDILGKEFSLKAALKALHVEGSVSKAELGVHAPLASRSHSLNGSVKL